MRSRNAILAGLALVLLGPSEASAERTYRVRITSEPEGAKIFLEDPESEPIGETPFDGDLPAANHNLILEAGGYETAIESITVKRSRRRQSFNFVLEKKPIAFITIAPASEGDDFDDSTILIDDAEREVEIGQPVEVTAGAHRVQVIRQGFETYEAYLEVKENATYGVTVNFVRKGEGDQDKEVVVKKKKKAEKDEPTEPATVKLLNAWGGFEWGGRDFKYDDAATNLRDYNFLGARFRAGMVVHPLVSFGRWLGGIGVAAEVGFLLGPRTSTNDNGTPDDTSDDLSATNSWFDYTVDVRYRFDFAEKYWVAGGLGYGQNRFSFSQVDPGLEGDLAAVDYQAILFQVLGGARFSKVDVVVGLKIPQIRAAGEVQNRFLNTNITAFGFYGGVAYPIYGQIDLAARFFFDRYSYALGDAPMGEVYAADSAVDNIFGLTFGVGYRM